MYDWGPRSTGHARSFHGPQVPSSRRTCEPTTHWSCVTSGGVPSSVSL